MLRTSDKGQITEGLKIKGREQGNHTQEMLEQKEAWAGSLGKQLECSL